MAYPPTPPRDTLPASMLPASFFNIPAGGSVVSSGGSTTSTTSSGGTTSSGTVTSGGSAATPYAWTLLTTSPTGGVTALTRNGQAASNDQTPVVHASTVVPDVLATLGTGSTVSSAEFWFDSSATNQSPTASTVQTGTTNTAANIAYGGDPVFYGAPAPATAGTYYGKMLMTVTGTDAGTYVFATQAITVT
jgi:hypothetical protein